MVDDYQVREDIDNLGKKLSETYTKEEIDDKIVDSGADLEDYALVGHTHIYSDLENLPVIPTDIGALETWDTPNYNSTYINTSSTKNHVRISRLGHLATIDYYFSLNNAVTTSDKAVVDNIPSDFQPQSNISDIIINTSSVAFLITVSGSKIYLKHYTTGTQGGAITGTLSYVTKEVVQEVGSVELTTSSSELWLDHSDTATLTATVLDEEDNVMANAEVLFYAGETVIGSDTTDENGEAILVYSPLATGSYSLTAVCDEVSSESVSVVVKDNSATSVSVSVSSATAYVGGTVSVTVSATDVEGNASVGKSVVYNGSTIGTTDSDGEFTTSVTFDSDGTKTLTYSVDGVTGSASVVVSKISTTTTLSTSSASVTVGSTVTLSGSVSVNVANLSVGIYQGGTLVDTVYTDSSGNFSKTLFMSSVGSYSYTATFIGNTTYATSTSSSVSVTVGKITPTLTISGAGTYTQGTTNYITGSLTDNGTPIDGALVELWEHYGSSPTATTTTLSDGSYSFTIPSSVTGSYGYYTNFDGDSTYNWAVTSEISVIIVPEVSVGSVTLTGDNPTLSFKHDDECVLTATVYDDSSTPVPLEDMAVNFKIGSNVIGSAVTDSNGEAEYIYHSRGANNITITAQCETESDTFSIEDNWIYLTGATDYSPYWNMDNSSSSYFTLTTENSQYKHIKGTSDNSEVGQYIYPVEDIGLKSFEATAKVYWTCGSQSSYNHLFQVRDPAGYNSIQLGTWSSSKILGYLINGTNKRYNPSGRLNQSTWYIFKARYDHINGTVYTAIIDESSGNIIAQNTGNDTFTTIPYRLFWAILYSYSTNYLKELKVQSLTTQTDNYNIGVTGDAEILSAYDNDTMTVTVTVTDVDGEPVANQSVELFYQGETQDTGTTNSNGVATFTYTATGFGNATVYAYVGTNAGKYDFIDAKYYASNSDIPNGTGTNILPYPLQNGNKIHFRFHSLPTHTLIGVGNTSTSDYVLEKNGDTYKYHRNTGTSSGTPSSSHSFETGKDLVFIKTSKTSPTRMEIFKNNTYVDWWTAGNSANRIRVDKFSNDDFDIEVFVI